MELHQLEMMREWPTMVLSFQCPRCLALPGAPCYQMGTAMRSPRADYHIERKHMAQYQWNNRKEIADASESSAAAVENPETGSTGLGGDAAGDHPEGTPVLAPAPERDETAPPVSGDRGPDQGGLQAEGDLGAGDERNSEDPAVRDGDRDQKARPYSRKFKNLK